jgi:hypothetical protein
MRYSVIPLVVGSLLLVLGLYVLGSAMSLDLSYARNLAACNTAPWCGGPPPAAWWSFSVLSVVVLLVFLGSLVLSLGIVRLRRERRGRFRLIGVQPDTSS